MQLKIEMADSFNIENRWVQGKFCHRKRYGVSQENRQTD